MNHLRRIISLLLVLVLCFGLIPGVSAAEVDTPGTDTQTEATEAEKSSKIEMSHHEGIVYEQQNRMCPMDSLPQLWQ